MRAPFGARITTAVSLRGPLCVGIDPHTSLLEQWGLPVDANGLASFAMTCVEAFAGEIAVVKPQSAFFEAHGSAGVAVLERMITAFRQAGTLVLLDVKRGDIGSTAQAYADAFIPLADAVTVNPYLGRDSLELFVEACRREGAGMFCLVKTSNPGSADLQDVRLANGRLLWQHVADIVRELGESLVGECGLSSVGAVVGATFPAEVVEARQLLPQSPLLLPGIGAQGGAPAEVAGAFSAGPASALLSASRSVIYASSGPDWRDAAAADAERLAREAWRVSRA